MVDLRHEPLCLAVIHWRDLATPTPWRKEDRSDFLSLRQGDSFIRLRRFAFPHDYCEPTAGGVSLGYRYGPAAPSLSIRLAADELRVRTDPGGATPLFFYSTAQTLYLASDFLALVEAIPPAQKPSPNLAGLVETLMLANSLTDETLLEGVTALHENAELIAGQGRATLRYDEDRATIHPQDGMGENQALDVFEEKLDAAFSRILTHLEGQGAGAGLSGGTDSSIVAHRLRRHLGRDFPTYSILLSQPPEQKAAQQARLAAMWDFLGVRQSRTADIGELPVFSANSAPRSGVLYHPDRELYWEPTQSLARQAATDRLALLFTGFGGDELMRPDRLEEQGFQGVAEMERRNEESWPPFLTAGLRERYVASSLLSREYPRPRISHSVRSAMRVYAPVFHEQGVFPVAPLGDSELLAFCRTLPPSLRDKKHLLRAYQRRYGFPLPMTEVTRKDSFAPDFVHGLRLYAERHLNDLLEGSVLARLGLVSADKIRRTWRAHDFSATKSELARTLCIMIPIELFLQSYVTKEIYGDQKTRTQEEITAQAS